MTCYEKWSIAVSFCGIIIGALVLIVYSFQLREMCKATNAATSAADTARKSLSSSNETSANILNEMKNQSNAMQEAANAAKTQASISEKALSATIDSSRTDQRAWVGIANFETIGGLESEDRKTFSYKSIQITIRNSGKTPARNLSAVTIQTFLPRQEKVGDYDSMSNELKKREEEISAKFEADEIKRNPQNVDRIKALNQAKRTFESRHEANLFPAGQVLAPGVAMTTQTLGLNYAIRDDTNMTRLTVYILGKITYNDIFPGTKIHTTKFCIMREVGDSFTICPTGNWMD